MSEQSEKKEASIYREQDRGRKQAVEAFARRTRPKGILQLSEFSSLFRSELRYGQPNETPLLDLGFCKPLATYEAAALNEESNAHQHRQLRAIGLTRFGLAFHNITHDSDNFSRTESVQPEDKPLLTVASFVPSAEGDEPFKEFRHNELRKNWHVALMELRHGEEGFELSDNFEIVNWQLQQVELSCPGVEGKRMFSRTPVRPPELIRKSVEGISHVAKGMGQAAAGILRSW